MNGFCVSPSIRDLSSCRGRPSRLNCKQRVGYGSIGIVTRARTFYRENSAIRKATFQTLLSRLGPFLFFGGIGCLYLDSFIPPSTPIYQGDTLPIYLLEAVKMLGGQVMYRDFFQFTLPGTQVFYLLLFKLFGVRAWIPSAMWIVLGISWHGCPSLSRDTF